MKSEKSELPAPRYTIWAALIVATALGSIWLSLLAVAEFFSVN